MDSLPIKEFEELVAQALRDLPREFSVRLDNIDVVVAEEPAPDQLMITGIGDTEWLLGLYEGIPLTGRENYGFVLPDKITIFQRPIEKLAETRDEAIVEIRNTVVHEVAHHFGMDDESLHRMGL